MSEGYRDRRDGWDTIEEIRRTSGDEEAARYVAELTGNPFMSDAEFIQKLTELGTPAELASKIAVFIPHGHRTSLFESETDQSDPGLSGEDLEDRL